MVSSPTRALKRDILVIGASAGGVMALRRFVSVLPEDLAVAVFIAVHVPASPAGALDDILRRSTPLPATFATDGAPIVPGKIVIAPPGFHLLLERDRVRLSSGPKEHGTRPAIDPLFRSAAVCFTTRVMGVVLTGWLDDGTAGLLAIKRCGGLALVQDPDDARAGEMPRRAIDALGDDVDAVLPAEQLARRVVELSEEAPTSWTGPVPEELAIENELVDSPEDAVAKLERLGKLDAVTCPECGGPLWRLAEALERYRCYQGHAFTALSLSEDQAARAEQAMWSAVRLLEERANTLAHLARSSRQSQLSAAALAFDRESDETRAQARLLRRMLLGRKEPVSPGHG